jgi:hypothetical protein
LGSLTAADAWGLNPPSYYSQYLIIQGSGSNVYQTLTLKAGSYDLSFFAAARPGFRQVRLIVYQDSNILWRGFVNRTWDHFNITTISVKTTQTVLKFINEFPPGNTFDCANFIAGVILNQGKLKYQNQLFIFISFYII